MPALAEIIDNARMPQSRCHPPNTRTPPIATVCVKTWQMALTVFALLLHASAFAEPSTADWQVRPVDATYTIADSVKTLHISNPDGDIRIRAGNAGTVLVHAVTQGTASVPAGRWSVRTSPHRWELRVPHARKVATGLNTRVDLVIMVPTNLALDLRSQHGRIEVRKHDALVRSRNDTGATTVTSTVAIDLQSDHGPIIGALIGAEFTADSQVISQTGAIDLAISAPARFDTSVRACGGIAGWPDAPALPTPCPRLRDRDANAPFLRVKTKGRFSLSRIPAVR